jgi:hypothetical protein
MDIRLALRRILIADVGLTALVGNRIFGGKLPQRITDPAIVMRLHESDDIMILNSPGVSNLTKSTFRFGCVVRGDEFDAYDKAADIDIELTRVLIGFTGRVSDGNSPEETLQIAGIWNVHRTDFYDDPTESYWVRSDWEIHHARA